MPAEAAIKGVNEAIVSVANTVFVFVAGWFPGGELAVEEDHIDYIFIDLRGREFKGLKCKCVPPRWVFRHTWKDITRLRIRICLVENWDATKERALQRKWINADGPRVWQVVSKEYAIVSQAANLDSGV